VEGKAPWQGFFIGPGPNAVGQVSILKAEGDLGVCDVGGSQPGFLLAPREHFMELAKRPFEDDSTPGQAAKRLRR
jgi:hypothetical protein